MLYRNNKFIAPSAWTHHHLNRLMLLSRFTAFCFIIVIIFSGLVGSFISARAQSDSVQVTATVPEIQPGSIIVIPEGGGGYSSLPILGSVPPGLRIGAPENPVKNGIGSTGVPSVAIENKTSRSEVVFVNGKEERRDVYFTQRPLFSGKTSIKNAVIFIEIHSPQVIRATTRADKNGVWSWNSTELLTLGPHTVTITAQDPQVPQIRIVSSVDIYIRLITTQETPVEPELYTETGDNVGNLFDIFVSVPDQFKVLAPGDDLLVRVKLVNFGSVSYPVDVIIDYTIVDLEGKVILTDTDTVAVATQLSIVKSFSTSPILKEGMYNIIVRVPSKGVVAVASESFEVNASGVLGLGGSTHVNFSIIYQTLLILLFFFSLVAYFEYNKIVQTSVFIKQITENDLKPDIS